MVIFLYNLYIFVWIKHGCSANTVSALDPNNKCYKEVVVYKQCFESVWKVLEITTESESE